MPKRSTLPVILVLDNIRSLLNVGAIFRSAASAGVEKIILGGLTPHPPRHEISKTALGAVEALPWEHHPFLLPVLQKYKQQGYQLCAIEQTAQAKDLYQTPLEWPLLIVVGHEKVGVSPDVLQLCDQHLELPMHTPAVHSLNVSHASAITLYELQRRFWYDQDRDH